jgi:hypothetical protein
VISNTREIRREVDKTTTAIVGAVAGAVFTALATWVKSYVDYAQGSRRALLYGALACRDRLLKIRSARERLPEAMREKWENLPNSDRRKKTINNELYLLGEDLDRYLNAIAAGRAKDRCEHLSAYEGARPILIDHDLREIDEVIKSMRTPSEGRASWISRIRAWFRQR